MRLAQELFVDVYAEAIPLLIAHYEEIAWNKDKIQLDPDLERYKMLERQGKLKIYTLRNDEGRLVGYAAWLVLAHLHYKSTLCAANDVIYVAPAARGIAGTRLLKFSEAELRKLGVQVLGLHIKTVLNWGPLAECLKYERTESNYHKWIGG
jgi:L-amino acid N-acyltransferase YncA